MNIKRLTCCTWLMRQRTAAAVLLAFTIAAVQGCLKTKSSCSSSGCDSVTKVSVDTPKIQLVTAGEPEVVNNGTVWMVADNPDPKVKVGGLVFTYNDFFVAYCSGSNPCTKCSVFKANNDPDCRPLELADPANFPLLDITTMANPYSAVAAEIKVPFPNGDPVPIKMPSDGTVSVSSPYFHEPAVPFYVVHVNTIASGGTRNTDPIRMKTLCDPRTNQNCAWDADGTVLYEATFDSLTTFSNATKIFSVQVRSSSGARPSRIVAIPSYVDGASIYAGGADTNDCYWDSGGVDGSISLVSCDQLPPGSTTDRISLPATPVYLSTSPADKLTWVAEFKLLEGGKPPLPGEKVTIDFTITTR